jgi:hypothetical protein
LVEYSRRKKRALLGKSQQLGLSADPNILSNTMIRDLK